MNETKNWKLATFILIGVLLVMLACCVGAWFGGLAGYRIGRRSARAMVEHEVPYYTPEMPSIPQMPECPELPQIPSVPEHPEMPWEGDTAWLGVAFSMVDEGALVALVVPESAAEAAGLQEGDIITKVEGRKVTFERPLDEHITRYEPGDRIELTVLRDGEEYDVSVRLGVRPEELPGSPMQEDGF